MIYNAGLLRCLNAAAGESGGLFIDDAYLLAIGNSMEETHGTLKSIMERPEGVFEWAEAHNCEFGVDKFQLIDFTRRREPDPTHIGKTQSLSRPDITLRGRPIPSREHTIFLGVAIDKELRWKAQGARAIAKGQAWAAQIQ